MAGGAVIAAAAAAHQRRLQQICDAFRLAGATAPERARSLEALGLTQDRELAELERAGVLRHDSRGREWYLDEAAYIARRDSRRGSRAVRLALVAVMGVLALIMGALIAVLHARHPGG